MQAFPFLMFSGDAGEAIDLYESVFEDFAVESMDEEGGLIRHAQIVLAGQRVAVVDSPALQGFDFTPSMSLFVECDSEDEVDRLFEPLSEFGKVLMALDSYPFARRFAWVQDRFGLSWQLRYRG